MTEQELTNFVSFYGNDDKIKLAMVTNVLHAGYSMTVRAFDQKANEIIKFESFTAGTIEDLITTCAVGDLVGYTDSAYGRSIKNLERNFDHEQRLNNLRAAYNAVRMQQM